MAEAYNPIEELMFGGMNLSEGAFGYQGGATPMSRTPLAGSPLENWYMKATPYRRAYHGTHAEDFEKFRMPFRDEEKGVFFTPDPKTASMYAGAHESNELGPWHGGNVFPVDVDLSNAKVFDAKGTAYHLSDLSYQMDKAAREGHDFLIVKNMSDVGGQQDQIIALKPAGKVKSATTGSTMLGILMSLFGAGRRDNNQ